MALMAVPKPPLAARNFCSWAKPGSVENSSGNATSRTNRFMKSPSSVTARLDFLNQGIIKNRFRLPRRKLGVGSRQNGIDLFEALRFRSQVTAVGRDHSIVAGFGVFDAGKPQVFCHGLHDDRFVLRLLKKPQRIDGCLERSEEATSEL